MFLMSQPRVALAEGLLQDAAPRRCGAPVLAGFGLAVLLCLVASNGAGDRRQHRIEVETQPASNLAQRIMSPARTRQSWQAASGWRSKAGWLDRGGRLTMEKERDVSSFSLAGGDESAMNRLQTQQFLSQERDISSSSLPGAGGGDGSAMNRLQTQLLRAVSAEDYATAAALRKRLDELGMPAPKTWAELLDIAPWLAERTAALGYLWPTPVQELGVQGILQRREDTAIISETGSGKTLAYLLPLMAEIDPAKTPATQVLVVVPSRSLGVQVVMLAYQLMGGSINKGTPGNKDNMFRYQGPRGLHPYGVFEDEIAVAAARFGRIDGCQLVVGTPQQLQIALPALRIPELRAIVIDEADALLTDERDAAALDFILAPLKEMPAEDSRRPVVTLVGATMLRSTVDACRSRGWVREPIFFANPTGGPAKLPGHVEHRIVSTPEWRRLVTLVRLIRNDILERPADVGSPARTMIFVPTDDDAAEVASKLRPALWGEHMLVVLKPSSEDAQYYVEAFRDNKVSLLIATDATERGLDLPNVAHVYCLGMPRSAASYVHRAGRVGRIGNEEESTVTTIVDPENVVPLNSLLAGLGVSPIELPAPDDVQVARADAKTSDQNVNKTGAENAVESERALLEDIFQLLPDKEDDDGRGKA